MSVRRAGSLATLALVACGGGEQKPAAPARPAAPVVAPVTPTVNMAPRATMGPNGCLHDGRWRPCSFVDRIERSGLVVTLKPDSAHYDFLGVPGLRYTAGRADVEAFFYDDTTRLARDLAAIDTTVGAPRGTTRDWPVRPTFVRSGNLLAILLTLNEHAIERLSLAIEGGAPQPNPDVDAVRPTAQPLPATRSP